MDDRAIAWKIHMMWIWCAIHYETQVYKHLLSIDFAKNVQLKKNIDICKNVYDFHGLHDICRTF